MRLTAWVTGNRESIALSLPTAGSWRAAVKNTIGAAVTTHHSLALWKLVARLRTAE